MLGCLEKVFINLEFFLYHLLSQKLLQMIFVPLKQSVEKVSFNETVKRKKRCYYYHYKKNMDFGQLPPSKNNVDAHTHY